MKKALITGANGFIGSAVVSELLSNRVEVIAIDKPGCIENIPEGARVETCELRDIRNLPDIVADRDIDVFYHFAWFGSAGEERKDVSIQLQNVQWTIDCIEASNAVGCRRFVCSGSIMEHEALAAVYKGGNKPDLSYIYGSGKLAAHMMATSVAAGLEVDLIWTEITNAYGAGELSPRFINTTIRKILNGEPLQFTAGTQNYDFIYVTDVAKAFFLMGLKGKPFHSYVIGSGDAKPLREFILEIKESIAPEMEFRFGDVPYTGIILPLTQFDISLLKEDTGFLPSVSFRDGVRKTMEWLAE